MHAFPWRCGIHIRSSHGIHRPSCKVCEEKWLLTIYITQAQYHCMVGRVSSAENAMLWSRRVEPSHIWAISLFFYFSQFHVANAETPFQIYFYDKVATTIHRITEEIEKWEKNERKKNNKIESVGQWRDLFLSFSFYVAFSYSVCVTLQSSNKFYFRCIRIV